MPLVNQTVAQVVIRNGSLRWPVPADLPGLLNGQTLKSLTRRAKYILAHFDNGVLLLHLGMSGRICLLAQDEPPQKHDHFDICFSNRQVLRLRDPRRFGAVLWAGKNPQEHMLLKVLGPEPLGDVFTGKYLHQQMRTRSAAIKTTIMDSHLVVGVGNIYAAEALFRAGIRPTLRSDRVSRPRAMRLHAAIREVLSRAVEVGGSTLRDFANAQGDRGHFQLETRVYGRGGQPCHVCGTTIRQIRQGQRSTFFCPVCQKS